MLRRKDKKSSVIGTTKVIADEPDQVMKDKEEAESHMDSLTKEQLDKQDLTRDFIHQLCGIALA